MRVCVCVSSGRAELVDQKVKEAEEEKMEEFRRKQARFLSILAYLVIYDSAPYGLRCLRILEYLVMYDSG